MRDVPTPQKCLLDLSLPCALDDEIDGQKLDNELAQVHVRRVEFSLRPKEAAEMEKSFTAETEKSFTAETEKLLTAETEKSFTEETEKSLTA